MPQAADRLRRTSPFLGPALLCMLIPSAGLAQGVPPEGMPRPNWPSSEFHGVPDGATGKPIPCRCLFKGEAFRLGSIVCMNTAVGTVLTICDLVQNTTSWVPSAQRCTTSGVPQTRRFSAVPAPARLPLE
jgi:hypothetical protein